MKHQLLSAKSLFPLPARRSGSATGGASSALLATETAVRPHIPPHGAGIAGGTEAGVTWLVSTRVAPQVGLVSVGSAHTRPRGGAAQAQARGSGGDTATVSSPQLQLEKQPLFQSPTDTLHTRSSRAKPWTQSSMERLYLQGEGGLRAN